MKITFTRSCIATLIVSVTVLATVQPRAEAMLVPYNTIDRLDAKTDRDADSRTIQATLESKVIRARLHALGLSDAEIQSRLSRLSDAQRHQLASQIRAVNPAGEFVIGLLVAVVLVLLIIYLIKRI